MEILLDSVLDINTVPDYVVKKNEEGACKYCELIAWLGNH